MFNKRQEQQMIREHARLAGMIEQLSIQVQAQNSAVTVYQQECDRLRKLAVEGYLLEKKNQELTLLLEESSSKAAAYSSSLQQITEELSQERERASAELSQERERTASAESELAKLQAIYHEKSGLLEHVLSYAEGYYPLRWATGLIPYWRRYYGENYKHIEQLTECLKRGLDQESCQTIDTILNRNFSLLPSAENAHKFLYHYDSFYTQEEKNGLERGCDKEAFRSRFVIPAEYYIETTVVEFHNGLRCLPKEISAQIEGKAVIDGGAFWGDSALAFLEYMPSEIHSFEPSPENFQMLCRTVSDNQLEEVIIPNCIGISDRAENQELISYGSANAKSIIGYNAIGEELPELQQSESISLISIDEYVRKNQIDVGLIKLDVEGFEYQAIQGALDTIRMYTPILLISIYHMPKDFFEIKPILESMELGYKFMVRKTTYRDLVAEVMLIGYVQKD